MAGEPGKKLFHAIVVVGASLAGCEPDDEPRADAASALDAAPDGAGAVGVDAASSTPDANAVLDANDDAASDAIATLDAPADAARDAAAAHDALADAGRDAIEHVSFPHITL